MPSGLWHFALSVGVCSLVDDDDDDDEIIKIIIIIAAPKRTGYHLSIPVFLLVLKSKHMMNSSIPPS